jgi:hypothetical protein
MDSRILSGSETVAALDQAAPRTAPSNCTAIGSPRFDASPALAARTPRGSFTPGAAGAWMCRLPPQPVIRMIK